jgi:hypothetical protein
MRTVAATPPAVPHSAYRKTAEVFYPVDIAEKANIIQPSGKNIQPFLKKRLDILDN